MKDSNRAILTQIANRMKSATTAADYLEEVTTRFPKALALQCIPDDPQLWQLDQYEEFLQARRQLLATELNSFLDGITITASVAAPAQLEELIAEGESDELEFKSSLRWDYQQGIVNKKLEDVIIKAVAAFTNADGGTLLIGVDDDGNVLGLENDYASLDADRDKFELHLRNVLNQQFGVVFVTSHVDLTFPFVYGVEVCRLDIKPASEPKIIKMKDNSGQVAEKCFVRSGNSSQEIPLSQMLVYIRDRFVSA